MVVLKLWELTMENRLKFCPSILDGTFFVLLRFFSLIPDALKLNFTFFYSESIKATGTSACTGTNAFVLSIFVLSA